MRIIVLAGGLLMAGCAAAPQTRFETSTAMVLDPANGGRLSTDVGAVAKAHEGTLAGCFDRLAERMDTDRLQAVAMTFTVRDATATLTGVHPENHETIVDADLESCLDNALVEWRLQPKDAAEVRLSLKVTPRRLPALHGDVASSSRALPPGWHPTE